MAKRARKTKSRRPPKRRSGGELIVIADPTAGIRAMPEGVRSALGADTASLNRLCASYGATLKPLFGVGEERLLREERSFPAPAAGPNLSVYYRVDAPQERLHDIASAMREQPHVLGAYVKPLAEPAGRRNSMTALRARPAAAPQNFFSRQGYLAPAPQGIDVQRAWAERGGRGANVRIVDIEGAWRFTHQDLLQNQGGVIGGTESPEFDWRNHGTAVIGVLGGDDNGIGVTGICPDAIVSAISIFDGGSAAAIRAAANFLAPGDVILIELHRPGPRNNFEERDDQDGYIAIEWWPDDFDAIRFATLRGICVVEAAGNGSQNLNDPIYNTPAAGFPANWRNPFSRGDRDCGAIMVGAGAPPPGTHGRNHGPDRSRLDFSNFGSPVDAQGWGEEVTTCGYGDLQGGGNEDLWYTDQFSGTSSASPIITGTVACLQGILRAHGAAPLVSRGARDLLRIGGSFQEDAPGRPSSQRIGSRPDLRILVGRLMAELSKSAKDLKDKEGSKDSKEKDGKDSKEKEVKESKDNNKDSKEKEGKDSKEKEHKDRKDKDGPDLVKAPELTGHKVWPDLNKGTKEVEKEKEKELYKETHKDAEKLKEIEKQKEPKEHKEHKELKEVELTNAGATASTHFIGPDLRPDLAAAALSREEQAGDTQVIAEELRQRVLAAKEAKDAKDIRD